MSQRYRPRAFISIPDNQEKLTHMDIKKGLESNDLNVKEKNLRLLVTYILNSENFPQMIIDVIHHVVPHQDKSKGLKKYLFLYWEIVDKFKPDGSLKDEFILVCNNFRKDLLHPNEYVVGRALRLVSSIHNKFIQESLIESVVDKCLVHIDMYVRRSAVVCLARVLEYFGPDFLPDIVDKLEGSLEKETDLTTKRNIFLLFIKLDRDRAINYLLTRIKEEDHEGFGDILQLIILKTVQEAMIKDRKVTGTCLKIIKEFANSKFSSVLYEVASALIRYNRSPESLRIAVGILIQVLKNNNDNNVKLLILEQLDIVRRRDRVVLIDCFIDLVTLLFSGDLEIKQRFLPFMEGFIRKENVGVLQKILVEELKLCLNDKTIEREYQTRVVLLFNRLVTQGILTVKIFLSTVLPVILHASPLEHSTFEVVRIALQNIFQHISNADKKAFLEVLKQSLQEIKDIRICGYVITLLSQHVQAEEEVKGIMSLLLQSVGDLPLKRRESKQDNTPTEVKEEKKFIRKTVIKPDGTYGDELVEVTDDNKAELTPEEVVYYKIRDFCMDSEDFCLSLARGFARLLSKLKPDEQDVKIVQGSILLLLCEFLKYFQGKNFESTDRSTIKQITACLKMIANKKFVQNGRFIFDEVLTMDVPSVESQVSVLSTNVPQDLEQSNQQEGKSMIGEFTVFRQLKGAKAKQLDLETADIADIAINEDDNSEEDYSTKLSRLVQLTGSSDDIYIEAFVKMNKFDTFLELVFINRTKNLYKNICLSFFTIGDSNSSTSQQNCSLDSIDNLILREHETQIVYKTLKVTPKDASVISANLSYECGTEVFNFVVAEIQLDLLGLVRPFKITPHEYRDLWEKYNWENKIDIKTSIKDPKEFVEYIAREVKMDVIGELSSHSDGKFLSANLCAKTFMGYLFLVNINIENDEGRLSGHIRLRCPQRMIVINLFRFIKEIQFGKKSKSE